MKTMLRGIALLVATLAFACCFADTDKAVTGFADLKAVVASTDALVFRGDGKAILTHTDFALMPEGKKRERETELLSGKGVASLFKYQRREIIDARDFATCSGSASPALHYTRTPEKFVVYWYVRPDGSTLPFSFPVFQEQGQWRFAAGYLD
ncbi:MAG: hypothetical protein JSS11_05540 [Verrucomicrobia bacterium]|nr:hypothetical protein [Verrucomicrobiota bacterium]